MSHEKKSALLVIDVQAGIARDKGIYAGWPKILANIVELIARARANNMAVIFVQHDGAPGHRLEPGTGGWALCPELGVRPSDTVIRKTASDSFFGTHLESTLRERGIGHLIVAGCMTEYCVDTTVRRAVSLGFDVTLAGDAHGTWNSPTPNAGQIIEHHNGVLDQFSAGHSAVKITPTAAVAFS
jgi:nicotinamidase-related amidase